MMSRMQILGFVFVGIGGSGQLNAFIAVKYVNITLLAQIAGQEENRSRDMKDEEINHT